MFLFKVVQSALARSVQFLLVQFRNLQSRSHTSMCLITTVAFAALLLGQAYAHPALASSRRDLQGRAVDFNAFRLGTKASYGNATYTTGSSVTSSLSKRVTYIETAKALVQKVALGFEVPRGRRPLCWKQWHRPRQP